MQVTMIPQTLQAWDAHVTTHAAVRTALGAPAESADYPPEATASAAKATAAPPGAPGGGDNARPYSTIEMRRFLRHAQRYSSEHVSC